MADVCRACALRAQRAAASIAQRQLQRRAFSVTSTRQKKGGVPEFSQTSSPELDDVLLTLRNKHFIPAYLNKRQRNLIYKDKFKQELENQPAYATLGEEEVALEHVDRRKDIPNRSKLLHQALDQMQTAADWKQLPNILESLAKAKAIPKPAVQEKMIRRATLADQLGVVVACLRKPTVTGITLKNDNIVDLLMRGLRSTAQLEDWKEENIQKALANANNIAQLLEQEGHTRGRAPHMLVVNDPRTRSSVIGQFLELVAVHAYKYHGGRDTDGSVKKYAERLMPCFDKYTEAPALELAAIGPQSDFLRMLPVWHALTLARKILGSSMPNVQVADRVIQGYEDRLVAAVSALEVNKSSDASTYTNQALEAWSACIRD